MIPIVIICGGKATRLYPVTKTLPKYLIQINETPFISYLLDLLHRRGIKDVILCVDRLGDMIEKYVGNGSFWGLNVKYSYADPELPLGTGGAVKNALPILPEEFLLTYGDAYLDVDYQHKVSIFHREKKPLLITVYKNNNIGDKSNILFQDGKIINYDKIYQTPDMQHIDYGLMVANKSIFEKYPEERFDLSVLMQDLIKKHKVSAAEEHTQFYEIGSFKGIEEFRLHIQ